MKKDLYTAILLIFLIYIIISEVIIYSPPFQESNYSFRINSFSLKKDNDIFTININITISAPINSELQIVFLPLKSHPTDYPIYIYYDSKYPSAVSDMAVQGLIDHLSSLLKLNSYNSNITVVNAIKLREIMENFSNKSIIIIPTGVLPDTVHNKTHSLIGKWLESGGVMFWIGEGFLVYSGKMGGKLEWPSPENPGWEAQEQNIGFQFVYGSPSPQNWLANISSPLSQALDIQYSSVKVGAFISSILSHSGYILGKIGGDHLDRASVVALPIGKGWLFYFGGDIGSTRSLTGEDIVARDIAHILFSSFLESEREHITYYLLSVKEGTTVKKEFQLKIDDSTSIIGVEVFIFSKNLFYPLIYRDFIPLHDTE